MRRLTALAPVAALAALLTAGIGSAGSPGATDGGTAAAGVDTGSAIVQLVGDPLSSYAKTKPAPGKKVDFDSGTVKAYRAVLNNIRNEFRKWLRQNAPAVQVTGSVDVTLHAVSVELNGTPLASLRAAPMVRSVQYQALYAPAAHEDPQLALVHANEAWTLGYKGTGVKVAIIDSGIDPGHPCFQDGGAVEANGATNSKVIFAGVFHNKAKVKGYTPADLNGHGTHVAGTVACNEHTPLVGGGIIPYDPSGVAPAAKLGNFNVFPADAENARSEDIMNALDAAYEQGFDVANMSIGGDSNGIDDLLSMAVDNVDRAGMVVAVAAGNSGPGFSSVESPGKAERALTAGAITVGHYLGVNVTDNDESVDYAAAVGEFGPDAPVTGDLDVLTGTNQACTALPGGSLAGEIALILRGGCSFSIKIRNAQAAGAVGVVMRNNAPGPPIAMGQDGTPNQPTIPGVMVAQADGVTLTTKGGHSFTIDDTLDYVYSAAGDNALAGFSGHGPTDVDFRVKPDVVAPGVNVISSQPRWLCNDVDCWAFYQGTSMATPHLAGIAALVRQAHSDWPAWRIRSAIVNTADQGVVELAGFTAGGAANSIGAGRANAESAIEATVGLDPVSVSFGAVPSGSGRADTRVVGYTGGPVTSVQVTNETCAGVDFGVMGFDATRIGVTMRAQKGIPAGNCQGTLRLMNGATEVAHAMVYALIK